MATESVKDLSNLSNPRSIVVEIAKTIPEENINPSEEQILQWIDFKRIENNKDIWMFKTNITSRSATFTDIITDEMNSEIKSELDSLFDYAKQEDLILMKLQVAQDDDVKLFASYIVPKSHANKALMMRQNFYLSDHEVEESDILSMDIPTFGKRHVIVDPRPGQRVTYFTQIDYYGEAKMSILRMVMEIMRQDKGGLGLHAGSKRVLLKDADSLKAKNLLIFGLSGTGKTTLTTHEQDLSAPEGVEVLQDDISLLTQDGVAYGTEYGFYVKTADAPEHKTITAGLLSKGSVLENVAVNEQGEIAWKDFSHTFNGRAIVPRHAMKNAVDNIDLGKVDVILYNTRRSELPPIGRLGTAEQAAAFYALGESVITSAETKDPELIGKAKRVVGFDPFILGNEAKNIERIREIVKTNPEINCYVVNTGYVGDESNDISVDVTLACLNNMLRDKIEWKYDEAIGYEVPVTVDGIEWSKFIPQNYFGEEKFTEMMNNLRAERKEYLSHIDNLSEDIINSL